MTDTVIIAGLSLFVDDVPVIICALVNLDVVVNGVVVAASDALVAPSSSWDVMQVRLCWKVQGPSTSA